MTGGAVGAAPPLRHPGTADPGKPAVIMAGSGQQVTFAELDAYGWQVAHALRELGLGPGSHVAYLVENRLECPALQWGAHYAGLYYTFISTRLTPEEVAYIVSDCGASVLLVTAATAGGIVDRLAAEPEPPRVLSLGDPVPGSERFEDVMAGRPATPLPDATEGSDMLYSSGTTGRPKGVKPPLSGAPIGTNLIIADLGRAMTGLDGDSVYLSPAPFYHAAPCKWTLAVTGAGGTVVLLERFDAEAALRAIDAFGVTHSQWVPTMFLRLERLDAATKARYRLDTHRAAIHAAAPCPPELKRAMIDWWGPILHEYYAGTEGIGLTHCDSAQWLAHPGTVGRALLGTVRILDENGDDVPAGREGLVCFASDRTFEYHNDPVQTAAAYVRPGVATMGDIGRLDDEGFLYLTDRQANVIISGGVNIYPQEAENLLVTHPAVFDVAVIGVPSAEWGEDVLAIVQPAAGAPDGPTLERELIAFCREHLSALKCPRRVEFRDALPREPTGKLLKRKLRDEYWSDRRI